MFEVYYIFQNLHFNCIYVMLAVIVSCMHLYLLSVAVHVTQEFNADRLS